jgi:hypothetical protein
VTDVSPAATFGVLAYGDDRRLHREATVAALTLREFAPSGAEVVVLTDQPALYRWLSPHVTIDRLTPATVRAWRGPTDDRFRPKIETLRRLHAAGRHAVLVDTDTMARTSLAPLVDHLRNGGFVLYEREYPIASAPRRGDRRLRHEIVGRTWAQITAPPDTWMWNGGVIGVSGHHRDVMDRTLLAFDQMRQVSRHFALEQLAYSIVFPAFGPLCAATEWFVHFWANRTWFDRRIDRFLSTALIEALSPEAAGARLRERPIEGALDGRLSSWQRRARKVLSIEMDDDADRIE